MPHHVAIALGGNLGNPLDYFINAIKLLSNSVHNIKCATIYTTKPVDCVPGTPDFKNTVLLATFDGTPLELLQICQNIETTLGRPKNHSSHESRTIDLDILLFDNLQISLPNLTIPHPRMHERLFVLLPLCELLSAYAIIPGQNCALSQLLDQQLAKLDPETRKRLLHNLKRRGALKPLKNSFTEAFAPACPPNQNSSQPHYQVPPFPEFIRVVTTKLKDEWDSIVHYGHLNPHEARRVPKPDVEFVESIEFLGRFYPNDNRIAISYALVMEHPWYAVLDVFYHEVAHQLVHYLYPEAAGESSHGKTFRMVCKRIGADPSARASNQTLDSWLFTEEADKADPLIERVRKLLVLAEKGDEHEAEVALSKAVEMMAKYGISEENLHHEEQYVTVALGEPKHCLQIDERMLAFLLREMFSVSTIMVHVPAIVDYKGIKTVTTQRQYLMCGTVRNVKIAHYVYYSLLSHIDLAWAEFCKQNGISPKLVRRKRDFAYGVITELHKKMKGSLEEQTKAIILAENAELSNYYHARFPRIRNVSYGGVSLDPDAYKAGKEIGSDLTIKPGIEKPEGPKLLS